jgi:predicted ATPase/transcriptional regulator with XRE-family HTH domain
VDEPVASFAGLLRGMRESRSLTQEELAERAGLTVKAIGALERGERRRPYPHTVRSLAQALDLDDAERAELVGSVPSRSARTPDPVVPDDAPRPTSSRPLTSAPTAPSTSTIGRDQDAAALTDLLLAPGHRVVTVTGPGGVGKTRLALEVTSRLGRKPAEAFPGGIAWVELAAVREPAMVLPRMASALGVPENRTDGSVTALAPYLTGRRILVVLDNLEQLMGAAPLVAELVAACPDLVVLATSRAPLRIRAEHELPLSPLPLPDGDTVASASASPAVGLFLDRAAATGADLALDEDSVGTISAICRRLDGLPLALELAAAQARFLTPQVLLTRLDQHAPGGGLRDLPDRQRTMTATLDWSHDLLEPEEQGLLARLAVFAGSFALDAVEPVTGAEDTLTALEVLVDQSLVTRMPGVAGQPRFRLLEPVRQYAAARLQATGQATAAADRHAAHFLAHSEQAHAGLGGGSLMGTLDVLEADHANLRSAFLRLLETDQAAEAAELVWSVWLYLALRGHALEGISWLERLDGVTLEGRARGSALVAAAGLRYVTGDIARMSADADAAVATGEPDDARAAEAAILAGSAALFAGDLGHARQAIDDGLARAEAASAAWAVAHALIARGQLSLVSGDLDEARERLSEAEAAARELGNAFTLATALNVLATLTEMTGDHRASASLLGESTELSVAAGISWTLGYSIPALAGVAAHLGEVETAAWLFGASASLSASHAVSETFPASRALTDQGLATVRDQLGEQAFRRAWDAGRIADLDELTALVEELRQLALA